MPSHGLNKKLDILLHPYVFVLKEGRKIKDDYLNYSLMILQVTCPEKIPSPNKNIIGLGANPFLSDADILSAYHQIPPP